MGPVLFLSLGIVGGVLSGMMGIGGGTVVVPALVYWAGMSQHKAQGTVLAAFLLPVSILAVLKYHRAGQVDLQAALLISVGLFLGALVGAQTSLSMSETMLKRAFGVYLLLISIKYLFGK